MKPLTIDTNPGPSIGFLPPVRQISNESHPGSVSTMRSTSTTSTSNNTENGFETVDDTYIEFPSLNHAHHLGHGSFGIVIEVKYKKQPAALKIMAPNISHKEVVREATVITCLSHENVIQLYAVYKNQEKTGLLLELMVGGSLHQLLHSHRQVKYYADHAMGWAFQCIRAISYIHSLGYLHRDIKPSNMLLSDNFINLKLCDFGTAANLKTTMTNNRGSAAYMSPEVFAERKYDQKCDIYSFAISFWEMLTRKFPFDDCEPLSIQWQVTMSNRRPEKIKRIPEPLMELIERCWHKDPKERPEAEEIKKIIEIIMESCGNRFKPLIDLTTNNEARATRLNDPIPVNISAPADLNTYENNNKQQQLQNLGFGAGLEKRSDGPPPKPPPPNFNFSHRRTNSGAGVFPGYPSTSSTMPPPYPADSAISTPAPNCPYPLINTGLPVPRTTQIGFAPETYIPPYQPQTPIFSPTIQAPNPMGEYYPRRSSETNGNISSGGENSPNGSESRRNKKKHSGLSKIHGFFSKH